MQVFSFEFCKNFKNGFLNLILPVVASGPFSLRLAFNQTKVSFSLKKKQVNLKWNGK